MSARPNSRTTGTQQSGKAVEKMKSKMRFPTFPQPRRLRVYELLRDMDSAGKIKQGEIMASPESFVAYIMDQLAGIDGLTSRKMFGEFALFKDTKVVALICEAQLFIKQTVAVRSFIVSPSKRRLIKGQNQAF